jgi:formylglycine-generating enzyme required for sulfatase activity
LFIGSPPGPLSKEAEMIGRRRFLGGAVALAACAVVATGCESATNGASADTTAETGTATTPSTTPSTAAAAVSGAASMVKFAANTDFTFATGLGQNSDGEAAPIKAEYALGAKLVTNAQWAEFLAAKGGEAPGYWSSGAVPTGKADHPVLAISAEAATAFCEWLTSSTTGWTFRLPTEAEWENAARGDADPEYPWGDDDTQYANGVLTSRYNYNGVAAAYALANFQTATYTDKSTLAGESVALASILSVGADGSVSGWIDHSNNTGFVYTDVYQKLAASGGYTTAVGAYPAGATASGLFDLAGNCYEWTSSTITATNGAEAGLEVLSVRGGSWYATSRSCRTTYRGGGRDASGGYATVGLRMAATAKA